MILRSLANGQISARQGQGTGTLPPKSLPVVRGHVVEEPRCCAHHRDRSGLAFQVSFCVDRGHTASACGGNGLTIHLVGHIPSGEYPRHTGGS